MESVEKTNNNDYLSDVTQESRGTNNNATVLEISDQIDSATKTPSNGKQKQNKQGRSTQSGKKTQRTVKRKDPIITEG